MAKKEQPYKVISKPPEGYKLPDSFCESLIRKAIERVVKQGQSAG